MKTHTQISWALRVGVVMCPMVASMLLATVIYAECNHKVPVNIECQTDIPDDNCTGTQFEIPGVVGNLCKNDTKLVSVFENDFGRETSEIAEHTVKTEEPEDQADCYKYKSCKYVIGTGCVPDVEAIQKKDIYKGTPCA